MEKLVAPHEVLQREALPTDVTGMRSLVCMLEQRQSHKQKDTGILVEEPTLEIRTNLSKVSPV